MEILFCEALESITMDEVQLVEPTQPFGNLSHENPHDGRQSTSLLKRLEIGDCPLLRDLPYELAQSQPHIVRVYRCGCPDLRIGNLFAI